MLILVVKTVTILPSKGSRRTSADVVISGAFENILKDVINYNLKNIPKERLNWIDLDYNTHEFLFWKENKLPLTWENVDVLFNKLTGDGNLNISGVRKLNKSMFRKALSTWNLEKYGDDFSRNLISRLKQLHTTGDMKGFYEMIGGEKGIKLLRERTNEFINEIFGDKIPEVSKGKQTASTHELRQLIDNIKAQGDYVKFGNNLMTKDQVLALMRFGLETTARWTDIVPQAGKDLYLQTLGYKFNPIKINKKIANLQDTGIINAWENGSSKIIKEILHNM